MAKTPSFGDNHNTQGVGQGKCTGRPQQAGEGFLDQMRCTQCAAESFSAAARLMVENGQRCSQCGGELAFVPVEPPVPVGVDGESGTPDESSGGRFERE